MRLLPNTNINKLAAFVILAFSGVVHVGCSLFSSHGVAQGERVRATYEDPIVSGRLQSVDLREASGIASSKCQTDVYWTHNDSGNDALLYAINSKGDHLGVWKIVNAVNRDWEDIAANKAPDGKCYVFIGDIGNNELERETLTIYRLEEPKADGSTSNSSKKEPLAVESRSSTIKYPNERHNAEALLMHPLSGDFYIVTKSESDPSHVYKFRPGFEGDIQTLSKIGDLTVPAVPNGVITGGDISSDGKRAMICDYFAGYELELPAAAANFDDVWGQKPIRVDLGRREAGEAVAYSADGSFVIAISEKKNTPVNIAKRLPNR